jgi:uncharacterized protein (TIGR02271 family)
MSTDRDTVPAAEDGAMTLSAERLAVTTRRVPAGKAVLRKVIVVEQRTITVEVAHEEIRLEYVPFDGSTDAAPDERGAHLALPEFVLHAEEVVVSKRVVPTERVRVRIESVTEERAISADVRREQASVLRTLSTG